MSVLPLLLPLLSPSASAQDSDSVFDPTLPIPSMKYERPLPDFSWDLAVQGSYGDVVYYQQEIPPWIGFGVRTSWGRNLPASPQHRLGVAGTFFAEGPLLVHMSIGAEPHLVWDWISSKGLWVGAGVGGAAMFHRRGVQAIPQTDVSVAPSAAVRLGWSQTWTSVGRRLFVAVEPKVRVTNGNIGAHAALIIGSGRGY